MTRGTPRPCAGLPADHLASAYVNLGGAAAGAGVEVAVRRRLDRERRPARRARWAAAGRGRAIRQRRRLRRGARRLRGRQRAVDAGRVAAGRNAGHARRSSTSSGRRRRRGRAGHSAGGTGHHRHPEPAAGAGGLRAGHQPGHRPAGLFNSRGRSRRIGRADRCAARPAAAAPIGRGRGDRHAGARARCHRRPRRPGERVGGQLGLDDHQRRGAAGRHGRRGRSPMG